MKKEKKAELFLKFVSELSSFYNVKDEVYTLEELIAENAFTEDSGLVHEMDIPGNLSVSLDLTYNKTMIKVIVQKDIDNDNPYFKVIEYMEIAKLSVELFIGLINKIMKEWYKELVEEYLNKLTFYESVGRILEGEEG